MLTRQVARRSPLVLRFGGQPRRLLSLLTPEEAGRQAEQLAQEVVLEKKEISHMATSLAHAGVVTGKNAAMSPPLHMATTYTRPADGSYQEGDLIYTRMDNPTRNLLEAETGRLECHGRAVNSDTPIISCAFASGMMAVSSIVLAHRLPLKVLLPVDAYHGVPTVLRDVFSRFDVEIRTVEMSDPAAIEADLAKISVKDDVIVWMESPSNPRVDIIDISLISSIAEKSGRRVTTVVDSTLAPPTIQQPLQLGADLVMHSATKYLGGHSDLLCGVVTASPWTNRGRFIGPLIRQVQVAVGGVASPLDSWLTLRGLRTLAIRSSRQCETALLLVKYLQHHPLVDKVYYPGLEEHFGHKIAKRQMKNGFGGVFSVEMIGESYAFAFAAALTVVQRATSLGGTETLIEHRASIEPPGRVVSPRGLLRVSVGLEHASDILSDFESAMDIVQTIHGIRG
jgi:cystathionine gamma-synthase